MLLNACSLVSPTQYHPQLPNLHTVHIIILHKFTTTATTAAAAAATYITTYTEFLTTVISLFGLVFLLSGTTE